VYYKRARAEAEEEEARVRQHMFEVVDDLEGFLVQGDPNQQMEDMIEDLHRPTYGLLQVALKNRS
jgi:hypothetical protein